MKQERKRSSSKNSDRGEEMERGGMSSRMNEVASSVTGPITDTYRNLEDTVWETVRNLSDNTSRMVTRRPYLFVAGALLGGFLVSRFFRTERIEEVLREKGNELSDAV